MDESIGPMTEQGDSVSPTEALGYVLDQHIRWIGQWHRAVFYGLQEDCDLSSAAVAFAAWVETVRRGELAHQPVVERLVTLHEQMHRQAKLLLLKSFSGEAPNGDEYESVIGRFEEFCAQIRRVERAFGAAASGLDPLTGLRTRRGMQESLDRELNRFRRAGQTFCLALADIDKFKSVNDTYGHDIGDKVLAAFAAVISRGIRSFDEAFRMGGEEFLICLKETMIGEAYRVIERLRIDLMNTSISIGDGREINITASFGLVQADLDTAIDDMIIHADKALYQAKHNGRNRVVRYAVQRTEPSQPLPAKADGLPIKQSAPGRVSAR